MAVQSAWPTKRADGKNGIISSAGQRQFKMWKNLTMEELDDRFSDEAKKLARLAAKASMEAVRDAWAHGLSVTVQENDKIVKIAPDGTKTIVKDFEPI